MFPVRAKNAQIERRLVTHPIHKLYRKGLVTYTMEMPDRITIDLETGHAHQYARRQMEIIKP